MPRYVITPEVERAILAAVRVGVSTDALAARFKCSDTTIRTVRKRHGLSAPTGSPRVYPRVTRRCPQCGTTFSFWAQKWKQGRRFCGNRCITDWFRDKRRKLPKDGRTRRALLIRLYWKENRTTQEIAKMIGANHRSVISAMRKLNIPTRPVGKATARWTTCREPGCDRPIYKVFHKTNGSWSGRRCYLHWVVYRFNINQPKGEFTWERRSRRLLRRAQRLVHAVSSTLNAGSEPAWTSPT